MSQSQTVIYNGAEDYGYVYFDGELVAQGSWAKIVDYIVVDSE